MAHRFMLLVMLRELKPNVLEAMVSVPGHLFLHYIWADCDILLQPTFYHPVRVCDVDQGD